MPRAYFWTLISASAPNTRTSSLGAGRGKQRHTEYGSGAHIPVRVYYYPDRRTCVISGQDQRPVPVRQPVCEYAGQLCTGDGGPWRPQGFIRMYEDIHSGKRTASAQFLTVKDSWCRVTMSAVEYGENGQNGTVLGIIEDITKEQTMALALEEANPGFTDRTVEQGGRDQDSPGVYGPKTPGRALRPHASGHG